MRLAIMQPYIFPYVGYYQLAEAADQFVFFDDVHFIKKGWIHRNAILMQGQRYRFTIPLLKASQNKRIQETQLHPIEYPRWCQKFLKTLHQGYRSAPFFEEAYALVRQVLLGENGSMATLAANSVTEVAAYLHLTTDFTYSSGLDYDRSGDGQAKVISICQQQQADEYVNAIGGQELYDPASFEEHQIALRFLRSQKISYEQPVSSFVPHLSIIDVLMQCSVPDIQSSLTQYELITPS